MKLSDGSSEDRPLEEKEKTFKLSLKTFLYFCIPIVFVVIIAAILSFISDEVYGKELSAVPVEEEEGEEITSATINAVFYVSLALVGATFVYFLLKYGVASIFRVFLGIVVGMSCFLTFLYFIGAVFEYVDLWNDFIALILILIAFIITGVVITAFVSQKLSQKVRNTAILGFSILLGAFLGVAIPLWSAVLILLGLSFYDIYSVFRGPIKRIVELTAEEGEKEEKGDIPMLVFTTSEIDLGIGDLTFYAMLVAESIIIEPFPYTTISAIIGIIIGSIITLKILEKKGLLPGLPLPILCGLGLILLTTMVF